MIVLPPDTGSGVQYPVQEGLCDTTPLSILPEMVAATLHPLALGQNLYNTSPAERESFKSHNYGI